MLLKLLENRMDGKTGIILRKKKKTILMPGSEELRFRGLPKLSRSGVATRQLRRRKKKKRESVRERERECVCVIEKERGRESA